MVDEIAALAIGISAASAIGSLVAALVAFLRAKRHRHVEVKLTNGKVVHFDDTMTKKQIEESLTRISGSVRESLHAD